MESPQLRELNEAALDHFVRQHVSHEMIEYLAKAAADVIRCEPTAAKSSKQLPPTPPHTPPKDGKSDLPSVEEFITNLCDKSNVQVPTLMATLVYLAKLKAVLPPVAKGLRCTVHRIFLAALILAAKYLNDSSPKNKHWARYSYVQGYDSFGFSGTEVNLMEKQLLFLLDFKLGITADDLYEHLDPFLDPIRIALYIRRQEERAIQERRSKQRKQQEAAKLQYEQYGNASQYWNRDHTRTYKPDTDRDPTGTPIRDSRYVRSPSIDAVPGLVRSTTGKSSLSSSASSWISQASTPRSSVSSYDPHDHNDHDMIDVYDEDSVVTGTSPSDVRIDKIDKIEMSGANPAARGGKGADDGTQKFRGKAGGVMSFFSRVSAGR